MLAVWILSYLAVFMLGAAALFAYFAIPRPGERAAAKHLETEVQKNIDKNPILV
jgi:hypothetical protein